jgi:predicted peptidase
VGTIQKKVELDYLVSLPDDYETRDRWPLLLFLHGAGERGSDVQQVKTHGPLKEIEKGRRLPFLVVAPQCPERQWWDAEELTAFVDYLETKYKLDPGRLYVTGLSMGGFGTWGLAIRNPGRFAAIAPVCGGGEAEKAHLIKDVPAWVVHGDADPVVPLAASKAMVEALRAAGGTPRFDVIPGGGHDVWTAFYGRDDLYEWLLSHRKNR